MDAREHLEDVERWRARRLAALTEPDGWLSLVGLFWLHDGPNSVGSAPTSDVVLPEPVPARAGIIEVEGQRAIARFEPEAGLTHGGLPAVELPLDHDQGRDNVRPSVIERGTMSFHLILREGQLAVRVRDAAGQARTGFRGIEHYPIDLRWRVTGRFVPYEPVKEVVFPTVLGTPQTYSILGSVQCDLEGRELSLEALEEPGAKDHFLPFGDATNRDETYGGGRYLYAKPPGPDGAMTLDFNRAYNPPCVFTPYATCILAPHDNRLPVRIEAGEKR